MTQHYLSTEQIEAWPQEKDGVDGYAVKYPDGYISWRSKEDFDSTHLPIDDVASLPLRLKRVTLERALVNDNLARLQSFFETELFVSLPLADRTLMQRQANAMTVYQRATASRVAGFPSYLDESQGIKFVEYFQNAEIANLAPEERVGMFGYDPLASPAP